jgi:intracellular multiplication protein IcmO
MPLDQKKYTYDLNHALRDTRPLMVKLAHWFEQNDNATVFILVMAFATLLFPMGIVFLDIVLILMFFYFRWLRKRETGLSYKLPAWADDESDPKNVGGGRSGKPEGILYLGNTQSNKNGEIWLTNDDIRTHFLYLGTTGAGKTEGLKSLVSNALCWGSGFVYIDGKADTDLWSSISSLCRRFGRDDDLLVLNYMTGNKDGASASNTLNPFSSGSASYLCNMLESLMPEAGGDNAMWKERAVALLRTIMPALTWLRDNMDQPMSISTIRKAIDFASVIKLARNEALPPKIRESIQGYLDTLPGYVDAAFDDNGKEKPMGPDVPQSDPQVPMQQHGYLTMQFTRSLQSLADDYSYIFEPEHADIDMVDVVLNRRILVVLLPALEKSGDETANLGKIIASTLKGMMGTTLGADVEGETSKTIENKPTNSSTPFMTVFDEVGYYVTDGMAVMAAQARSLGFSLVYAAQDLAALEKRVKEEARSITANCNIKIFGKLSDPTVTKDFFEKTLGKAIVTQVGGYTMNPGSLSGGFDTQDSASITFYEKIDYGSAQGFKEGQAALAYSNVVDEIQVYYCALERSKAMRVQRFLGLKKTDDYVAKNLQNIAALRDRLSHKTWTAAKADVQTKPSPELEQIIAGITAADDSDLDALEHGVMALTHLYASQNPDAIDAKRQKKDSDPKDKTEEPAPQDDKKTDMSWGDIMGSEDPPSDVAMMDQKTEEETDEDTEKSSSSSGGISPDNYSAEEAVAQKADSGMTILPDNLSDEVKAILKSAADTLTSGLFSPPTMDRYAEGGSGDSKGFKASNVSPNQQPGRGGR